MAARWRAVLGGAARCAGEAREGSEALRAVSASLAAARGGSAEEEALRARAEALLEQCVAENAALAEEVGELRRLAEARAE